MNTTQSIIYMAWFCLVVIAGIAFFLANNICLYKANNKVAKFEKVSYYQFKQDMIKCFGEEYVKQNNIRDMYNKIELPTRATKGSAGYDFKIPTTLLLSKGHEYLIPTGIRVKVSDGWVLQLYPRSGLGSKRGLRLSNTVGIIDSDYYNSDNEGHIMAKITHEIGDYTLKLKQGQGFIQGIFVQYGTTRDDIVTKTRNGGFGSTDKNS